MGRLALEKDIEKIREVLAQSEDFCLTIVGDGPHRAFLENHFQDTNTVFTGFLYGDKLASAYASAYIFIFPSTKETLGLVLLEAMASGLPVVAASSGPTSEQVEHGKTGLLYDPENPADFTRCLFELKKEAYRRALADRSYQSSQKNRME